LVGLDREAELAEVPQPLLDRFAERRIELQQVAAAAPRERAVLRLDRLGPDRAVFVARRRLDPGAIILGRLRRDLGRIDRLLPLGRRPLEPRLALAGKHRLDLGRRRHGPLGLPRGRKPVQQLDLGDDAGVLRSPRARPRA
jgi:hypothetical protein